MKRLLYLGIVSPISMPQGPSETSCEEEKNKKEDMKSIRRTSVVEQFQQTQKPIPDVTTGGARVKVHYAGACYTERQVQKTGRRRPKMAGIQDTSLYPGYEISGVVDALCNTVTSETGVKVGTKVIIYPEDNDDNNEGYEEYVVVKDVKNLIPIPETLSLQVAAMLPSGALTALSAIKKLKPFIEEKANSGRVNMLIVGAGALGLWTITLGRYMLPNHCKNLHIIAADTDIEKLMIAKEHGCADVIHWNDAIHEEYLIERTKNTCVGGVDIIIDYSSTSRTINRAMQVLAKDGVLVVGGNAKYEVSFCLHKLAKLQQNILGVSKGTREQLIELVDIMAEEKVKPPMYHIFPVDEANKVFDQINAFKITGRAVLEVCPIDSDDLA